MGENEGRGLLFTSILPSTLSLPSSLILIEPYIISTIINLNRYIRPIYKRAYVFWSTSSFRTCLETTSLSAWSVRTYLNLFIIFRQRSGGGGGALTSPWACISLGIYSRPKLPGHQPWSKQNRPKPKSRPPFGRTPGPKPGRKPGLQLGPKPSGCQTAAQM